MNKLLHLIIYFCMLIILLAFGSCKNQQPAEYHYSEDQFKKSQPKPDSNNKYDQEFDKKKNKGYYIFEKSLPAKKTGFIEAQISFGSGTFKLVPTNKHLCNVSFYYKEKDFDPHLDFYYDPDTSNLEIKLKRTQDTKTHSDNKCKVELTQKTPINLDVAFGAGEGTVLLNGMDIQSADFAFGAGEFNVVFGNSSPKRIDVAAGVGQGYFDLSGSWKNSCDAEFACGIGELTLVLPKETGVRIEISGLLGDIDYGSLKKVGRKTYENDAYSHSENQLNISISAALGSVKLEI